MKKNKKNRSVGKVDVIVLEEQFEVAARNDGSRIHVSERQSLTRGRFNTLQDPVTRELTITGIDLRWDGSVAALEALLTTRDVTRLVLIADEIRIEQELLWKGASVDIYARRLTFRDKGRIVTTPEDHAGPAFSVTRDKQGNPLNAEGTTIEAADGLDGEPGGEVRLFVAELDVGETKSPRVVADGQPGQKGESGYSPPAAEPISSVTRDKVLKEFGEKIHSTGDLSDIKHWETAGGKGEEGFKKTWNMITHDSGEKIVDVWVGLAFQQFAQQKYNEVRVPFRSKMPGPGMRKVPGETTFENAWKETLKLTVGETRKPSNGGDAKPSGTTGLGGSGGAIVLPASTDGDYVWYSNKGGASPLSDNVEGGPAGEPKNYIVAALSAVQSGIVGDRLRPYVKLEVHRSERMTKPGKRADGRAKGPGEHGKVIRADVHAWLEPRLLRTMADYAGELYAAGHRELAWEAIAPYWQQSRELSQASLGTDTRSSLQAIGNLVQNYQANLDLYGNPPGWVPRFSASNYLRTYLADRRFSYRFVGVMEEAIALMDSVEHANAMLGDLAERTEDLIDQLRTELFKAFKRYHNARVVLEKARSSLLTKQEELTALRKKAELAAIISAQEQKVVKAVFDISAAMLKAIPAYQPALAGIGTVVEGVGSVVVDSMKPNSGEPFDGWTAVANISASVEGMLKENAGSFKSELVDDLRKQYKDQLDPETVDLKSQVDRLRVTLAGAESKQARAADDALNRLKNHENLADLLSTDPKHAKDLADLLEGNVKTREDLLARLNTLNVSINELDSVREQGSGGEITNAAQRRLVLAREKLYVTLSSVANERGRLERRIEEEKNERSKAIEKLKKFENNTSDLITLRDAFDELFKKEQTAAAEEKIKQAGETAGKVLEGAQRMAHGAATIATSIASVSREPTPDDDEVQAMREQILKGQYGEQYAEIQEEVGRATAELNQALSTLMSCNQGVTTLTADFAGAIQSSIEIGRNRLAFARGVDAGLKTSLVSMRRQARERMDYYLYLFRKAYMYEECVPVPPGVANLNTFLDNLGAGLRDSSTAIKGAKQESAASDALRGLTQLTEMTDNQIKEIGNDAMCETLSELANDLLRRRQVKGFQKGNTHRSQVAEPLRRILVSKGRAEFGRVLDLIADPVERQRFLTRNPLLKLAGIAIAPGDLRFRAKTPPHDTLRLVFEFGRELMLWDGDQYVMFRIGSVEEPLKMGFSASKFTPLDNDEWSCSFKADEGGAADELFKTVSREALGDSVSYTEIRPSFLSALSASFTMGAGQVKEITQLSLTLEWQAR